MLKFSNLSILWKILCLFGLLSACSIGGAVYATNRMRSIDNSYGDLLDGFGRANLAIARANRNLVYIDRSIYRLLAETEAARKQEAAGEATDSLGFFQKQIKSATQALPEEKSAIAEIGQRVGDIMSGECADVLRLGASVDAADGKAAYDRMRAICDPALNKAMLDISALTNRLLKASDAASDATLELTNSTITASYFYLIGALVVLAGLAVSLARYGIAMPIRAIVETLDRLSHGETDTRIPGADRADEVGMMARAAVRFRDQSQETLRIRQQAADAAGANADAARREQEEKARAAATLAEVVAELGRALKALASGDLAVRIETLFAGAYAQLRENFNEAVDRLGASIGEVVASARAIEEGAHGILSAADELAESAQRQTVTVEETSFAVMDLSGVVNRTADASTRTKDIITSTKDEVTSSMDVVNGAERAIETISESSSRIGAIIGVIDEIAFQTNLLALNAGVEAARAGDAGRGFAVVASEVRALAQRSAEAAKEIKSLVSESADKVTSGVELVKASGAAFDRIRSQVAVIDGGIADIAGQAVFQAQSLKQVNIALSEIDGSTQTYGALANRARQSCQSLSEAAVQLMRNVGRFHLGEASEDNDAEPEGAMRRRAA
jgi:methyl-accepting chemotaxis protein